MSRPDREFEDLFQQKWQKYVDSIDLNNLPEHKFSSAFEETMERLIQKQRRMKKRTPVWGIVRKVAVILVICCTIAFSGLMTVEAFRERVIHFFTQVFSTHTEIEISTEGYEDGELVSLELGYLPEGMEEVDRQENLLSLRTRYEDTTNFVSITQRKLLDDIDRHINFDTEDANTEQIIINEHDVWIIREGQNTQVFWILDNYSITLNSNLPWNEITKIVENLIVS